jgi:hypothetical protein
MYERANSASRCSVHDVMLLTIIAYTDGSLMLSALNGAEPHGPFVIPKVDDADEAIWRVVCEQKVSFSGEVA